ncbi:hypothetical protein [Streptomyces violascens]|uniref:Uncharacterized protein n=1 Tax=Streptomyces violascens TaxID=67381 RepID=A0ABQ3QXQ3_9ACTN|nr:hypothetical protein GCM10010289_44620 [Streptomyces violascens]GHI42054.1 hypothetical protein Sviol_64620 [Streptomyces violascens]
MRGRGADVIAVECRRALSEVPVALGDDNALPLAEPSQDLITYVQSWQWADPARHHALPGTG